MNKLLSLALMLIGCYSAQSQKLILQPQIGIRNYEFQSNDIYPKSYEIATSPSAGLRMIYQSKKGHGPYLGFYVNSLIVKSIYDRQTNTINYALTTYELGYQWMSKPIYFKNMWDNNIRREGFESLSRKGWAIQFNPNLGISNTRPLIRDVHPVDLRYNGIVGLNAGMGFVFSNNGKQIFNLSVNYTKGISGDLYNSDRLFTTAPRISTKGSGFNIGIGVPINLLKRK